MFDVTKSGLAGGSGGRFGKWALPVAMALSAALAGIGLAQDGKRQPGNYDEAKVAPYNLPDPLKCFDGTVVADATVWRTKRRPEILGTFESQVYGRVPPITAKPTFDITSVDKTAFGGKATRKLVTIRLLGMPDGPLMHLLVYVPNAAQRPVPAFVGLNFVGNQGVSEDPAVPVTSRWVRAHPDYAPKNRATAASRGVQASRWQLEMVLSRGYATATAYYGDLEEDHPEGWKNGIRGALPHGEAGADFKPDEWAAISAWAWGLSRAMDYLAADPEIDARRVIVHGHSRLGKTALWAGALDERFAMVISNNSGEGGASLYRRDFGETIAIANGWEPHRFCGNFRRYNGKAGDLPVDAHLLVALAAPRPVYVASATEDLLADPRGEFLAAKHAEAVYGLYGMKGIGEVAEARADRPIGERVGYHLRTGKHDITAYDWAQYLNFADRHLPPR